MQQPLRKKPPKPDQEVHKTSFLKPEERERFLLQFRSVLKPYASKGSVALSDLEKKFLAVTKTNFQEMFQKIRSVDIEFTLEKMVEISPLPCHQCFIERCHEEPLFMFLPNVPNAKSSSEMPVRFTENYNRNGGTFENEQSSSTTSRIDRQNERDLSQDPSTNQFGVYAYEMFCESTWKNIDTDARKKNQEVYNSFLNKIRNSTLNKNDLSREAKHVAEMLWAPHLRLFPHTLYLLRQLSIKHPDGFPINEFEDEMESVVPASWKVLRKDIEFDLMLTGRSVFVNLNLIMGSSEEDINMMKVNKVIDVILFHEIFDHETSMIYHYVSCTPYIKTPKSIHSFMCNDYPGWKNYFDEEKSFERILHVCKNDKMFHAEGGGYTARSHAHKIPVPMSFSLFLVYKQMGISQNSKLYLSQ